MRQTSRSAVEVITPRPCRRSGIVARRIALTVDERDDEDGIPVTTPARTLFDLAAVVSRDQLEYAFNEAEYRRIASPTSHEALLARYPGHRGTAKLRRVLEKHEAIGTTPIRSVLEQRFLTFLDATGLPRPLINRVTDHGELDRGPSGASSSSSTAGRRHGTRRAFEADRARDRVLVVAGWRVIQQLRALPGVASPSPSRRPAAAG